MACEIIVHRGAVLTVWGKPQRADMMRIHTAVKGAAADFGGPVVYVTRVPVNAPTPTAEALRELNVLLPDMMAYCSSYHIILEGDGFRAAMKRAVITGILQPIWQPRVFFVHATAFDVMERLNKSEGAQVSALFRLAGRRQLLHGPAPITVRPGPAEPVAL